MINIKFFKKFSSITPRWLKDYARQIYNNHVFKANIAIDIKTQCLKDYVQTGAGKWHKVYAPIANNLLPPLFYGALRVDMHKNTVAEFPEAGVLELKKATLQGYDLISREGYLVPAFSRATKIKAKQFDALHKEPNIILNGVALILHISGNIGNPASNYGHFILDVIGKIHLFWQAGYTFDDVDYIVGPETTPQIKFLLQQIDTPLNKYIQSDHHRNHIIQTEKALIPSFPGTLRNAPGWLPEFYRNHALPPDLPPPHRRLYVSRAGYTRNPVNIKAVKNILHRHQFEIIDAKNMSQKQIMYQFSQAAIVVGAHGAGLTDIVFCQPHTKLLELVPTDHVQPYYYTLANAANMTYSCLVCRSTNQRGKKAYGPSPYDFYVNADELEHALTSLIQKA